MEVINKEVVVGEIHIPIKPTILDIVDEVKKLTYEQHVAIVQDGGLTVPAGMDSFTESGTTGVQLVLLTAMSFVQNVWYKSEKGGEVPQGVLDAHNARLEKFGKAAAKVAANPPAAPKAGKAPKEPKAAKGPKAAKAAKVATEKVYVVNHSADAVAVANLSGFRIVFYTTIKNATEPLTKEQVLTQSLVPVEDNAWAPFKTEGAANSQVNYQLKELVASNIVLIQERAATTEVAEQTEPATAA